ncbi:MAG TPA: Flp family type IVb pilin [Caulobacterales bacterium]|jgi:Flp pilus assembly pilin Flp|nr:Flp family type IVb pilin [Caulobacterales bacterium]
MKRALKNKSGATAIEYGLVMGIAALLILTAMTQMGQKTSNSLNKVAVAFN